MTSTGGGGGKGQVEPFLRSRPPKNSWLPSDALRLCSTPPHYSLRLRSRSRRLSRVGVPQDPRGDRAHGKAIVCGRQSR